MLYNRRTHCVSLVRACPRLSTPTRALALEAALTSPCAAHRGPLSFPAAMSWTAAVLCVLTAVCARYVLRPSPLDSLPGPRLARLTPLWIFVRALRGTRCYATDAAFARHGPVVRVGPNLVAINDPSKCAARRSLALILRGSATSTTARTRGPGMLSNC